MDTPSMGELHLMAARLGLTPREADNLDLEAARILPWFEPKPEPPPEPAMRWPERVRLKLRAPLDWWLLWRAGFRKVKGGWEIG